VRWYERTGSGFAFHATPLDVGGALRAWRERGAPAWIFTSATLTVGGGFDHFLRRVGIAPEEAETLALESPFDFERNALIYQPEGLPDPNHPRYLERMVEATLPVVEAVGGRTFLLFTSHRALRHARALLEGRLAYPMLVQGEAPRVALVARFRELGNAVLLGTASFWEGVDVRGPALSCVVIDRLPFGVPDDPVFAARAAAVEAGGGNAFMEIALPEAVLALKQGAGRLIRDMDDRGVLVLCDPRVRTKSYGRFFMESLPPMPLTSKLEAVRRFLAGAPAAEAVAS